jgi:hypothetical protein
LIEEPRSEEVSVSMAVTSTDVVDRYSLGAQCR